MELNLHEQIERINNIDKDEKSIILIKAIGGVLSIDHVVDTVINMHKDHVFGKEIKMSGLDIIDKFRDFSNYMFLEKELKKFCGFHEEDETSSDIIFNHFSKKGDIGNLKKELIDLAQSQYF